MNLISTQIREARKNRGLSQEDLAEKAQVNLRTIQRIENNENEPQGKTLNLICEVLQLDLHALLFKENSQAKNANATKIVNGLFLLALNLVQMGIIGFLTLDSNATINSKFGGILLSFFIPLFIVMYTKKMNKMERLLKFGTGYIAYFVLVLLLHGFPFGFVSGLFPCLLISLSVLYFGGKLFDAEKVFSRKSA